MQVSLAFPSKGVFRLVKGGRGVIAFPSGCWRVLVVSVGAMGVLFGLGLVLPGLILLGGFSGTLLVVSIFHMGYDCSLLAVLQY